MKWLILMLALFSSPAWATWALVQNATNPACTSTSTTCAVTVTATGAGNVIIAMIDINLANTITSVSDGGSTYALCPTSECHSGTLTAKETDMAYALSAAGGATSITITRSAATSATWRARIYEFSHAGTASFDSGGNSASSTATTSPPGVALTLTGSNDVIVQMIFGTTPTAISGGAGYTTGATVVSNFGWAAAINTTTGTAPTWTQSSGTAAVSAIALTESGGAPPCANYIALMGAGCK